MSDTHLEAIKEILEDHPGKSNQISSKEIGNLIGVYEDSTHVKVRSLILKAISMFKLPIAGNSKGYYLIQTEAELQEYCKNLENRMSKINDRKNQVVENFYNYK